MLYTPQFKDVGKTEIDIQSIKVNGEGVGAETLQLVTAGGNVGDVYQWLLGEYNNDGVDGWCNDEFDLIKNVTLKKGESAIIDVPDVMDVTTSGEVETKDYTFKTVVGTLASGNFTYNKIDIQQVKLEGSEGFGSETIQFVTPGGNVGNVYQWLLGEYNNDGVDGWCDDEFNIVHLDIEPGDGFLLDSSGIFTVSLPSPFSK